ncbi:MAG: hypothetical protein J1F10_04900 [Muribaculaceae bacterium]|nr:hypothetical protein [Muribaculaceae bacterium]
MRTINYIFLLMAIAVTGVFFSCSEENYSGVQEGSKFPYIELPESVDFKNLAPEELNTLIKASSRIIFIENEEGYLELLSKNGKEINISENIYQYFNRIVDNTNRYVISLRNIGARKRLLTRDGIDGYTNMHDCVAWAIVRATGTSYTEVSQYLTNTYGTGGVNRSDWSDALNHFGNAAHINDFNNTIPRGERLGESYVIFIKNQDGSAHAVNGFFRDANGVFICHDYQNGGDEIFARANGIWDIYKYY